MPKKSTKDRTRLARIFRRYKWLIVAAWIVITGIAAPYAMKLNGATTTDQTAFLPQGTQSTQVSKIQAANSNTSQASAVIVFASDAPLTTEQKAVIESQSGKIKAAKIPGYTFTTPPQYSADGKAAIITVIFAAPEHDQNFASDTAKQLNKVVVSEQAGMTVKITGQIGVAGDIGGGGDTKLLITTVIVIAILLLITYRSPVLWILPLMAAGIATMLAQAVIYMLTRYGLQVDSVVVSILLVLVFGAATDYALLVLSRYREELHLHDDKHVAIAGAVGGTFEAIAAAAVTVTLALLALLFASDKSSQGLAIVGAIGILSAFAVQVTLLPAVLVIFGRRLLWPRIPRNDGTKFEGSAFWHKLSRFVAARPATLISIITVVLLAGAMGLTQLKFTSDPSAGIRGNPPSIQGQKLIATHFPAGSSDPILIVAPDVQTAEKARLALKDTENIGEISPVTPLGKDHQSFDVTLTTQPYSSVSFATIRTIRSDLVAAGLNDVLVGGNQATQYDTQRTAARDDKIIIPLILLIVTIVLAVLLRAVPAPIMLLATVILSFAFSFGVSVLVFNHIFKFPGVDPGVPLFSFLFIVALGVDYNIFLMDRARQETKQLGTQEGMLKSLRVTGGVITAAGLVLAGTFAALAQIPFVVLTELGFAIAFGILIDSFLVRSILVPAIVLKAGHKTWWPTKAAK